MKKAVLFIFLSFTIASYGHQDKYYEYKYDQVTVMINTGFYFEEINNVKIIGQYAAMLCKELDYNEPVALYFEHDYTHELEGKNFEFLSYGLDYLVFDRKNNYIVKGDDPRIENKIDKISISQYGYHFTISETLNFLLHGIENKDDIKSLTVKENIQGFYSGLKILSLKQSVIKKVKAKENSIVKKILKEKVYINPTDDIPEHMKYDLDVSYYSQYNKYTLFDGSNFGDEIKDIDTVEQIMFIDVDISSFYPNMIVLESNEILHFYAGSKGNVGYPYLGEVNYKNLHTKIIGKHKYLSEMRLSSFTNDFMLIEFMDLDGYANDYKLVFLLNEGKLVTDLVSFLNSHKTKN